VSSPAIRVENLSKAYRIGLKDEIPDTLSGALTGWMKSPLTNWKRLRRLNTYGTDHDAADTLWALKDVSFDIQEGEVLGVIGRNGAGKSTLLKILSRITEPTTGRVRMRGRVSSLLEVGTGFHPELSGRENVYMNGTILGMTKGEIDRKFDEIVDFSGVEKFLDTPVKRYSSGMKVRLAFAVAAHLEPEILIIDEVLAVGDVEFQQRCLGKMGQAARSGRTVLFVSHNLAAVSTLCRRGIVLAGGSVYADTLADKAVAAFMKLVSDSSQGDILNRLDREGLGEVRVTDVSISNGGEDRTATLMGGGPARLTLRTNRLARGLECVARFSDANGTLVAQMDTRSLSPSDVRRPDRVPELTCKMDELLLMPGRYRIDVILRTQNVLQDRIYGAMFFDVVAGPIRGRTPRQTRLVPLVHLPHCWQLPDEPLN
jgi:lipopolysaccharide transport system ATP-binding protein